MVPKTTWWRCFALLAAAFLSLVAGANDPNLLYVDVTDILHELPAEMNGAGCGIEFIEHEIYGGLYSQLVVGESFEEAHNATTGISLQWAGGEEVAAPL